MAHIYRDDFPLLKSQDIAYLDNAATAQRPQCVLDAIARFYRTENANPLRGLYPLSVAATESYEGAREAVRAFINAKSSREIVFTRNTTESLNLLAYSYGLVTRESRGRGACVRHGAPQRPPALADGLSQYRRDP